MIECLDSVFPRVALPQRGKGALERGVKQRRERIAADQRKRVMKPEVVIRCLNGILRIPDSLYRAIKFFVIFIFSYAFTAFFPFALKMKYAKAPIAITAPKG